MIIGQSGTRRTASLTSVALNCGEFRDDLLESVAVIAAFAGRRPSTKCGVELIAAQQLLDPPCSMRARMVVGHL